MISFQVSVLILFANFNAGRLRRGGRGGLAAVGVPEAAAADRVAQAPGRQFNRNGTIYNRLNKRAMAL